MKRYFFHTAILLLTNLFPISAESSFRPKNYPKVIAYQPGSHTTVMAEDLHIVVQFDVAIDPQSVDRRSLTVFGRWTGVCSGKLALENDNQQIRFIPSKIFSAGEWITVSLSKSIKSATGENMPTGFMWNFWISSAPGSLDLQKIAMIDVRHKGERQIRTYGAYAGDLNGDGFHDLTVPNEDASNIRVFLNDGHGGYSSFDTYILRPLSFPSTNEGGDFNGDGFLDFAVGNIGRGAVSILFGDGKGTFSPATHYAVGAGTRGLCILDLNGDGFTDIVTANRKDSNVSILLNNGDGTFGQSIQMRAQVAGETSCATADANEDGVADLFVGGFQSREIAVLLGDGNGHLTFSSKADAAGVPWMLAVGDLDKDGHVDVVSANSQTNQFALLRGDGKGNLGRAELYDTGQFPLAIDIGDLDGDADLDVVTSNFFTANWTVYENDGTGEFLHPRTLRASSAGSCAVLHDRDRDGDLDITGIDERDDLLFLFENAGVTAVRDQALTGVPQDFELHPSYPNPFSKTTSKAAQITVPFTLNERSRVKLEVLNLKGQTVASLLNTELASGRHSARLSTQNLPAGIYFLRLSSQEHRVTRKVVLLP